MTKLKSMSQVFEFGMHKPVTIFEPVKESECFVMEPDGIGPLLLLLLNLDELYSQ
jgi:hypothetical protein